MATFPKGIYANRGDKAPDYVICNVKVTRKEFKEWLDDQVDNEVRLVVKKSNQGKVYVQVDEYRPAPKPEAEAPQPIDLTEKGEGLPF